MSLSVRCVYPDTYEPDAIARDDQVTTYLDPYLARRAYKLKPGELYVGTNRDVLVGVVGEGTLLCVRDKKRSLMGMAHFMLPAAGFSSIDVTSRERVQDYGRLIVKRLLNSMVHKGSSPKHMEAFLVGGARIWASAPQLPVATLGFGRFELIRYGIRIKGEFIGTRLPRKVYFDSEDCMPSVQVLQGYNSTVFERETRYRRCLKMHWVLGHRRTSMRLTQDMVTHRQTKRVSLLSRVAPARDLSVAIGTK